VQASMPAAEAGITQNLAGVLNASHSVVLVHDRHGYRIEHVLCCGDVDPVQKLGVTL